MTEMQIGSTTPSGHKAPASDAPLAPPMATDVRFTHSEVAHGDLDAFVVAKMGQTLEESALDILESIDRAVHSNRLPGQKLSATPCRAEVLTAMAQRLGLVGCEPSTLDAAGIMLGVTRERIRQIQAAHLFESRARGTWWPQLDLALATAARAAPCTTDQLADALIASGVTATRYSVESLAACADFADRHCNLEVFDDIVTADGSELVHILRATRALSTRQGLCSIEQLSDELLDEGIVLAEDDLKSVLAVSDRAVWLDDQHVTWLDPARNRLVNTLRVILSVHQPVDLATVHERVARFWTFRSSGRSKDLQNIIPPTVEALLRFCEWYRDFAVTEDGLTATVALDFGTELGTEAAMLVDTLRMSSGGAMDRTSLMETAKAVGINLSTANVYLSFHPAFVQLARNVWSVLGAEVPPDVVVEIQRRARQRSTSENRSFAAGVSPDGHAWVELAATSNLTMTGVLMRQWLPEGTPSVSLALTGADGAAAGIATFNATSGFTHGLWTYMRQYSVRVGDYVRIVADVEGGIADVSHGTSPTLGGIPADSS